MDSLQEGPVGLPGAWPVGCFDGREDRFSNKADRERVAVSDDGGGIEHAGRPVGQDAQWCGGAAGCSPYSAPRQMGRQKIPESFPNLLFCKNGQKTEVFGGSDLFGVDACCFEQFAIVLYVAAGVANQLL